MQQLYLLGDSILDNAPYTSPEPDTTAHLQHLLNDWTVERRARDGARMRDVDGQLRGLRGGSGIVVLSVDS